jgi:signal transduction histidine kinase
MVPIKANRQMADLEPQGSYWYMFALERLVGVVRELSQARDLEIITAIVRDAAREMTGAEGATFVLRDGEQCFYVDENAIEPLWKGKRFPMEQCISGWVMLNKRCVVLEDIYADPRIPADAYRPTFVKSLAMVPICRNAPIGAIGTYWSKNYRPSPDQLAILEALADTTCVALKNAELYARLQEQVQTLQAQAARIQNQHSSLEVFTFALAHDLKEPVRTLLSYSDMLREAPEAPEKRARYMGYMHNAAARIDMLLGAVSRYTRLVDPDLPIAAPIDLNIIADEVQQNLAELIAERGATIRCENLPCLRADPAHLTQLLESLVCNAIVHNDRKVTVTIRHQRVDGISEFSVADDGIGLNPGQSQQIFLPFRRLTHREGCSGLGLASCRRICALYGGESRCESSPGQGATFTFTLPAAEKTELEPDYAQAD